MRQIVISLIALFASLALLIAGSSLLGTLLALRLGAAGYEPLTVGAVLVFHSIGFVFGTRFVTPLLRRVGQIRAFAAFAAAACAAILIHPMWISPWLWALLRVLVGFCHAGLIMVLEGWISGRASNKTRGSLLGIYQVVYFSAAAGGQFLVGLSTGGYAIFSLVAILVVLSLVPLAVTRSEAPLMGLQDRYRFAELWALSPSGLLAGAGAGVVASGFLSLAPLYAAAIGMEVEAIAHYMMFAVFATMLLQWPLGHLSDLIDRRRVLAGLLGVAALAALLGAAAGHQAAWALFAATGVMFGIAGCLYPISLALINDNMSDGNPVAASTGLLLAFGLGTCVGPLLGAGLMQVLGPPGLFVFLAVVFGLLFAFLLWRLVTTPDTPPEQRGRFVSLAATETAPALLDLDPRAD